LGSINSLTVCGHTYIFNSIFRNELILVSLSRQSSMYRMSVTRATCIPSVFPFRSKEIIIIVPGFSLKASLLHSWQCPAISNSAVHESCNVLKS